MEHLKTLASYSESNVDSGAIASEQCLSDDEILSFAKGELDPSRIEMVHAHLDGCVVCQQLVTEAVHALDAEPISESARPSWNTVFQPGAIIAKRYRILRLVARGGMGEVYEAFDTSLHERVALKTVTATHCDNIEAMRLLKAEVQHARRIAHPNVCRIFDLGTHIMEPSSGEIQFLVMEFIEGEVLGRRLRAEGPLPIDEARSIAHQLLLGLSAAHQAGILHRDFKSDNVMLRTESNGRVTAVILDFGLAKVLNESGNIVTTQQHQSQALVGTIGYMAPEQIEGDPLSAASDIYAFGVVWFEMLTGRLPFAAQTPAASAVARLHRSPEPPSKHNPKVPTWVDELVMRCLSRRRETRFASAEAVLGALAAGPSYSARSTQLLRRAGQHRLAITAAFVMLAGVIPVGLALKQGKQTVAAAHAGSMRTQATKEAIATESATKATRPEGAPSNSVSLTSPSRPRPKARNHSDVAGRTRSAPTPEGPAANAGSAPVASEEAMRSQSPPSASAAASNHEPDWLPLGKTTKVLKAQLQVE